MAWDMVDPMLPLVAIDASAEGRPALSDGQGGSWYLPAASVETSNSDVKHVGMAPRVVHPSSTFTSIARENIKEGRRKQARQHHADQALIDTLQRIEAVYTALEKRFRYS